jgi:hypothetical protein
MSSNANWTTITPKMAITMLEESKKSGGRNRNLRDRAVTRYADDMIAGRWQDNGQPIVFNGSAMILDGQHRLHAIVKSGIPQRTLVVRGVEGDAMLTIDTGIPSKRPRVTNRCSPYRKRSSS